MYSSVETLTSPTDVGFSCPICLDVMLRPVKLACGHHACRYCLVQHLATRAQRTMMQSSGRASCPLGRCEISAAVPDVDTALQAVLSKRFRERLANRSVTMTEADEARVAESHNNWVSDGFPFPVDDEEAAEAAADEEAQGVAARAEINAAIQRRNQSTRRGRSVFTCLSLVFLLLLSAAFAVLYTEWRKPADERNTPVQTVLVCGALVAVFGFAAALIWRWFFLQAVPDLMRMMASLQRWRQRRRQVR